MERPTSRNVADRDLRHLSTDDLLSLIREDIRELDALISARRPVSRSSQEKKPSRHKTAKEAMNDVMGPEDAEPEGFTLHSVTCCNHHMGDFPPWARVRCPFCSEWHRAGDSPLAS